jgi:hypothetical protein
MFSMSRFTFLTFETDQFLFLAMWDFLILHYCKTKKSRAFHQQMHAVQFMSTVPPPPILYVFSFLK